MSFADARGAEGLELTPTLYNYPCTNRRVLFDIFPLTGGCSEGLDAFRFFFKHKDVVKRHDILL